MNIEKTIQQIINAAALSPQLKEPGIESEPVIKSSIPKQQINIALQIAETIKQKASNLLSEAELAIKDLNGEITPSILESQDNFRSLVNKLKEIKRKLGAV